MIKNILRFRTLNREKIAKKAALQERAEILAIVKDINATTDNDVWSVNGKAIEIMIESRK